MVAPGVYQCRKAQGLRTEGRGEEIADAEFEADEYVIAVTRKVSRQVRDLVRKQPAWQLLDKEDICQVLRADIDRERARNIVEDAFDIAWRRAFLGPSGPLAFVEPGQETATVPAASRFSPRGRAPRVL